MAAQPIYSAPRTLQEAMRALGKGDTTILAGGTDILPRWSRGLVQRPRAVVDLKHVEGLGGVSLVDGQVQVGSCTMMSDIISDPIILAAAPVLAHAAGRIACSQIRNRATVGGNLCNASPAADTAVPLILLDAVLDLASFSEGKVRVRQVPIHEFFCGPGTTVVASGEILTRIGFKPLSQNSFAAWDKFGTRPAMEIAVASVGVALDFDGQEVARARVAYGSVAPVPLRGHEAEGQLVGNTLSTGVIDKCVAVACEEIAPITDVRASAAYRREVVGVMLRRMLNHAARD